MRRAAFLDRDGTLIELVHHLADPAKVRLLPGAGAAVRELRAHGLACVVVTNQSAIGRGLLTTEGLYEVHAELLRQLAAEETELDGFYFCPIEPKVKDPTVIEHPDRKPGPGMLLRAARDLELDLSRSFMIGDTLSDVLAGHNAGCRSILVRTGYGRELAGSPPEACYVVDDVWAASKLLIELDRSREESKNGAH
jgi:D-glycero-D-manno-heptose 1,7-bisphosphate phosphatase